MNPESPQSGDAPSEADPPLSDQPDAPQFRRVDVNDRESEDSEQPWALSAMEGKGREAPTPDPDARYLNPGCLRSAGPFLIGVSSIPVLAIGLNPFSVILGVGGIVLIVILVWEKSQTQRFAAQRRKESVRQEGPDWLTATMSGRRGGGAPDLPDTDWPVMLFSFLVGLFVVIFFVWAFFWLGGPWE